MHITGIIGSSKETVPRFRQISTCSDRVLGWPTATTAGTITSPRTGHLPQDRANFAAP